MSEYLQIHPVDPQARLLARAVSVLESGGLVVYPTDSTYAVGCRLGDKAALEKVRRLRKSRNDHDFTLVCRDLSEIASYARIDNWAYRLLKSLTPGPYTFILKATGAVPKRLQDPRRRSIGIRVPDNRIAQALLGQLGQPIMSSTLILPGDDLPMTEPEQMRERLAGQVGAIIDGGAGQLEATTIIDLSNGEFNVIRYGKGDVSAFES